MNKLEKLEEATILALQGKLQEAKSLGVKAGGIEVITGSGDQMGNVAPLLLGKDNKYIWVLVNWEELDNLADKIGETGEYDKDITLFAKFYLNEDNGPMQEDEQYEFINRDITIEDLEYFENEIENIKNVLIEFAKYSWVNDYIGKGSEFPSDVNINVEFGNLM